MLPNIRFSCRSMQQLSQDRFAQQLKWTSITAPLQHYAQNWYTRLPSTPRHAWALRNGSVRGFMPKRRHAVLGMSLVAPGGPLWSRGGQYDVLTRADCPACVSQGAFWPDCQFDRGLQSMRLCIASSRHRGAPRCDRELSGPLRAGYAPLGERRRDGPLPLLPEEMTRIAALDQDARRQCVQQTVRSRLPLAAFLHPLVCPVMAARRSPSLEQSNQSLFSLDLRGGILYI